MGTPPRPLVRHVRPLPLSWSALLVSPRCPGRLFQCAGTTLREVFTTWAIAEGYYGSVVQECNKVDSLKEVSFESPVER